MTKVKVKIEDTDAWEGAGEDQGDFALLPKGYYVLSVKEANPGYSKVKDSDEEDKTKPRVEFVIEALGTFKNGVEGPMPSGNYGNLWDYMTFGKDAAWKRAEMGYALGIAEKGTPEYELDTDEVVGTRFVGRVRHEKDNRNEGELRARLAKWLPMNDADAASAFGAEGGTVTEVEFGGGDEGNPFGAAEEEPDDGDFYTREGLEAIEDLKELGPIAEQFDLVPKDLVVSVKGKFNAAKTKANMIDKILEVQGVGDNGGEEGGGDGAADDESPF